MKRRLSVFAWCVVLATLATSCAKPVDKIAKSRIFSPEDPPKVVTSALEDLPAGRLADDAAAARRVLQMDASEVTERIGPHQYSASIEFEWTGAGQTLKLAENHTLLASAGGVNGDFHGTVENSRAQGLDVIRVKGQVYARNRYGKYRQRLRDRGMAEREREEIYGVLKTYYSLFFGRLKLKLKGQTTIAGREAYTYAVSLGGEESTNVPPESVELPNSAFSRGGMDGSSARRAAFFQKRRPRSLKGEIAVDAQKSVVLQARLEGTLLVASDKPSGGLNLRLTAKLSGIGVDPQIEPPKDFLLDADKPRGIAAALDRFGIPRGEKRVDGGTEQADDES